MHGTEYRLRLRNELKNAMSIVVGWEGGCGCVGAGFHGHEDEELGGAVALAVMRRKKRCLFWPGNRLAIPSRHLCSNLSVQVIWVQEYWACALVSAGWS